MCNHLNIKLNNFNKLNHCKLFNINESDTFFSKYKENSGGKKKNQPLSDLAIQLQNIA